MEGMDHQENMKKTQQLCDFAHNDIEDQKKLVDRMIDGELIVEDTYNQMIHVEHQKEIEFVTMASIYPIFHREEMEKLIRITDEMVDEYYQKEKKAYMYPAKAKLSMILIKGGETEEDKNRAFEKATKVYKELKPSLFSFKKGKDFAEVARKYSEDDETAAKGGRIEVDVYECRNAIDYMLFHGFHKEIFALNSGEISDVFEFENGTQGVLRHYFNGVLVTQVVAAFDGVKHVPFPVIFLFVTQGRTNSSLGGTGMRTGCKDFADNGNLCILAEFDSRSQSGKPGTNNNDIIRVFHAFLQKLFMSFFINYRIPF